MKLWKGSLSCGRDTQDVEDIRMDRYLPSGAACRLWDQLKREMYVAAAELEGRGHLSPLNQSPDTGHRARGFDVFHTVFQS